MPFLPTHPDCSQGHLSCFQTGENLTKVVDPSCCCCSECPHAQLWLVKTAMTTHWTKKKFPWDSAFHSACQEWLRSVVKVPWSSLWPVGDERQKAIRRYIILSSSLYAELFWSSNFYSFFENISQDQGISCTCHKAVTSLVSLSLTVFFFFPYPFPFSSSCFPPISAWSQPPESFCFGLFST